jgi:pimeloyl-ACP methyl ester carboxylesterase
LLPHGVASRRDGFLGVIDHLTPSYRVIAMDQHGHGFSGHTQGAYTRRLNGRPVLLAQANPAAGVVLSNDYLDQIRPRRAGFTVEHLAGAGHNLNRERPERLMAVVLP